jgi:ribosomal protein S18 acetylase RimI-like enzyme
MLLPLNITTDDGRADRESSVRFVVHGGRKDYLALGFLPRCRIENYLDLGWITFARINNERVGFMLAGQHKTSWRIYQLWVVSDARRLAVASAILNCLARQAQEKAAPDIRCWVAADLESNLFWRAIGFNPYAIREGGKARKRVHVGYKYEPINKPLSSVSQSMQILLPPQTLQ